MDIIQYDLNNDTHIRDLSVILKLRNMEMQDLPQIGYLAYVNNDLVSAGFLRKCEGNYAIFDGIITNPSFSPSLRNKTLDCISDALIRKAKELNLKNIIAWTSDKNTILRSEKFGFSCLDQTLIFKRIE